VTYSPLVVSAANELYSRIRAEESLYEFTKQAWHCVEGKVPFVHGWHAEAIAEHLQAAYSRQITRLLINVPPRSSKSTLISVCFPTWVWINDPAEKFLFVSAKRELSTQHSVASRRLIQSEWYQTRWGNRFQLTRDQNSKQAFDNDRGGKRVSLSVSAGTTGQGAEIVVLDDLNDLKDGHSAAKFEMVKNFFTQALPSRLNNASRDVLIVVQQRSDERDNSGIILNSDMASDWTKLILPMEYEKGRHCKTIFLPSINKVWEDPRTEEGELLCPERWDRKAVEGLKRSIGAYGYAGQYQQRPSPEKGGIFEKGWFQWWKSDEPPPLLHVIQSWDTAFTESEDGAYSACTTWGVFEHKGNRNIILLSVWRDRAGFPEVRERAQRLYEDYRDNGSGSVKRGKKRKPDVVLIESKASGISLIQEFIRAGIPVVKFNPDKYGNKIGRVNTISHFVEAGLVWVPAKGPEYTHLRLFAQQFVDEVSLFPKGSSRDLVDTMTQVLIRLRGSGWMEHPTDEEWANEPMDKDFRY
jgi:predicted phage terminase large subunit-like protein